MSWLKLPPRNQWATYSYIMARLLTRVSYLFGAFPVVYNIQSSNKKLVHVRSRLQRLRCGVCLSTAILTAVTIFIKFIYNLSRGAILFGEIFSMWQIFVAIGCFFTVGCHLHTVWKLDEMLTFTNRISAYYEQFQGNFSP
jgi:hypothetical protein